MFVFRRPVPVSLTSWRLFIELYPPRYFGVNRFGHVWNPLPGLATVRTESSCETFDSIVSFGDSFSNRHLYEGQQRV
jgi:hypothetical protein